METVSQMQFWYSGEPIFKGLTKSKKNWDSCAVTGGYSGFAACKYYICTGNKLWRHFHFYLTPTEHAFFLFENLIASILMNSSCIRRNDKETKHTSWPEKSKPIDYIVIDFLLWNTNVQGFIQNFINVFFSQRNIKSINFYMYTENISQLWFVICCVSHTIVKICEHILKPKKM